MPDPCCCAAGGVATAYFANGQVASNLPVTPAANAALLNEASYMFGVHVVRAPAPCHSLPVGIRMILLICCARVQRLCPLACVALVAMCAYSAHSCSVGSRSTMRVSPCALLPGLATYDYDAAMCGVAGHPVSRAQHSHADAPGLLPDQGMRRHMLWAVQLLRPDVAHLDGAQGPQVRRLPAHQALVLRAPVRARPAGAHPAACL